MVRIVKWLILLVALVGLGFAIHYLYLHPQVPLETARQYSLSLRVMLAERYVMVILLYMLFSTIAVMTLLPLVSLVGLLGGYLFGALEGGLYALIATTLGSLIVFMTFKYFFAELLRARMGGKIESFVSQLERHGATYLLVLYLSALIPGFVMIPMAAVAKVSTRIFAWTTFVGSAPFVLVYSYAGKELGSISSVKDIFSPELLMAFVLLALVALVPFLIKKYSARMRQLMLV